MQHSNGNTMQVGSTVWGDQKAKALATGSTSSEGRQEDLSSNAACRLQRTHRQCEATSQNLHADHKHRITVTTRVAQLQWHYVADDVLQPPVHRTKRNSHTCQTYFQCNRGFLNMLINHMHQQAHTIVVRAFRLATSPW